jgi:hypothetical protein
MSHVAKPARTGTARMVAITAIIIWFAAAVIAGCLHLVNEPGRPPIVLASFIVLPIIGFLVAYAASGAFRAFAMGISLTLLIESHLWRFVGIGFIYGWLAGNLAAGFAIPAGVGDVVVAAGSLALLPGLLRGAPSRQWLLLWNVVGLADLIAAIVLGLLFSNSAFGVLASGTPTTARMVTFPVSLIPTFFVPLFILIHLLLFRRIASIALVKGQPQRSEPAVAGR